MMALVTIHQCKSLTELPGAVARFERDVDAYEKRTQRAFPSEFKFPAFFRMVPKSHASDMRWRFSQVATDYDTLESSIFTHTQHVRFEGSYGKGDTDTDTHKSTPLATPSPTSGATGSRSPSLARFLPTMRASR